MTSTAMMNDIPHIMPKQSIQSRLTSFLDCQLSSPPLFQLLLETAVRLDGWPLPSHKDKGLKIAYLQHLHQKSDGQGCASRNSIGTVDQNTFFLFNSCCDEIADISKVGRDVLLGRVLDFDMKVIEIFRKVGGQLFASDHNVSNS